MGTDVRIVASPSAADEVETLLRDYDARLSRFRADSELSALNADPRDDVPASALLRDAVGAALADAAAAPAGSSTHAAATTSRPPATSSPGTLRGASRWPRRVRSRRAARAAAPDPRGAWRKVRVDDAPRRSRALRACASTPAAPARATPPTSRRRARGLRARGP